ncbi:MAG: hypothetical protein QM582_15150 [Micropruina sp.]|uniref:hypothetical protein n=1 Tax=Micropruina sp. TaxID=2737536 RepID=UPI0039E589DA
MKANPEVALVAAIWLLVETAVFSGVATVLALVIAGVRTYYGPWADPPGSDEVWYLLLAVAIGLAVWRFLRRWRCARRAG